MQAMTLMVLTARPDLASNRRLVEAGRAAGFDVRLEDALTVVVGCGERQARSGDGRNLLEPAPEAVLPRVGNWRPESLLAVLEALMAAGVRSPNAPGPIRDGRDHWRTMLRLRAAGLPAPRTLAGADPEALAAGAADLLGFPVVVKQRRSRMGVGVIRCDRKDQLDAVLDSLWRLGDEVIVQELIPTGGASLRLLVAGGEVAAAARFTASDGEWRSNAARGAAVEGYDPSPEEVRLALRGAAALRLGVCGVDLFPGKRGTVIGEVNPTPGFRHLEAATGIDVAAAIIQATITS